MKALTHWQPWATLIIHGPKRIENRPWKPPEGLMGEVFAIHAGKAFDKEVWEDLRHQVRPDHRLKRPPTGAIIGTARLCGVLIASSSIWWNGPFGWLLQEVTALDEPIKCKGAQGLWNVPEEMKVHISSER